MAADQEQTGWDNLGFLLGEDDSGGEGQQAQPDESEYEDSEAVGEDAAPGFEPDEDDDTGEAKTDRAPAEENKESEKGEEKKGPVPYHRFEHYVRKAQSLEQQVKERDERQARLEERINQINQTLSQRQQPQAPDPEEDPEGYAKHVEAERQRLAEENQKYREAETEQQKQQQESQALQSYINERESEFVVEAPDYVEAVQWAQQQAVQQLVNQGYSHQLAQQEVGEKLTAQAERFRQNGGDIARWAYSQAVNMGWKSGGNQNGNQGGEAASKESEKSKVDPDKGKKANRSVANAGQAADSELSAVDIDEMTDEQFQRYLKSMRDQEVPKIHW